MRRSFHRRMVILSVAVLFQTLLVKSVFGQVGAPSGPHPGSLDSEGDPATAGPTRANGVDIAFGGTNEPAIAVNPLNSQNIAAASLFRSRVSTNGGVNWTGGGLGLLSTLPAGYGRDGDSTLAFDSQGRLFWAYQCFHNTSGGADEFVAQHNPTTGVRIAGPFMVSTTGAAGTYNDKAWLAADRFVASPFRDRLYLTWSEFPPAANVNVMFSYSINQGATWSIPIPLSVPADGGFPWPAHVAVAPNGDVYVSYHDGGASGTSGKVWVLRSTNGGVSFPQKNLAFTAGQADAPYNVQGQPGTIPGTQFWLQGSGQAWVVPDATIPGNVYVVANDDPDNSHGSGDDSNVYIARSTNNGVNWNAPIRVDHTPGSSFAVMPTAAMDDVTSRIAVMWYVNRFGSFNPLGHYILDVYYSTSDDHGLTWCADRQINDVSFDPDFRAPVRFNGPPPTLRIGEYIGVTMGGGNLYAVWCGNTATGQQTIFDSVVGVSGSCSDCNNNGTADSVEIAGNPALDCNGDQVLDSCEIAADPRRDCNNDGILDECQMAGGDCDGNFVLDSCEIAANPASDCNNDSILDRCQAGYADCNGNGTADFCELAAGDCNPNGLLDVCELAGNVIAQDQCVNAQRVAAGVSYTDTNAGATNDGTDNCNAAGALPPDVWYKYHPSSSGSATISLCGSPFDTVLSVHSGCPGTTANQILCDDDFCYYASQLTINVTAGQSYLIRITGYANAPSLGDTGNFVMKITGPAAYAANDCNGNGVLDACQISSGTSLDCNHDGTPDECQFPGCPGILLADMNCDVLRDGRDIKRFIQNLVSGAYSCSADMNQDGVVNLLDLDPLASAVLAGP